VGQAIGEGKPLNEILSDMTMVAEGVMTSKSVHSLMKKYGVTMPISEAVYQILFKRRDPKESVNDLMARELKMEG
jgi:glycerol-3-phosphate dehydrogenase (NAD(P)+)